MSILAGFLLIPYGVLGSFRATEALRKALLPVADCCCAAMLGLMLVFAGLGLLMGTPVALAVIVLLAAWRGLALYNARLRKGRVDRVDVWPAAAPDLVIAFLVAVGSR